MNDYLAHIWLQNYIIWSFYLHYQRLDGLQCLLELGKYFIDRLQGAFSLVELKHVQTLLNQRRTLSDDDLRRTTDDLIRELRHLPFTTRTFDDLGDALEKFVQLQISGETLYGTRCPTHLIAVFIDRCGLNIKDEKVLD